MCGLSALFSVNSSLSFSSIEAMNHLIRHRGPDDEGFVLFRDQENPVIRGGKDTPREVFEASWSYCPKTTIPSAQSERFYALLGHRRLAILDLSPAGHQPMSLPSGELWITYNGEIYNYVEIRQELLELGHIFHTHSDTEVILHAYKQWGVDCLQRFNGMFAFVIFDQKQDTMFAARDRFGVKPLYYWKAASGTWAFVSEIKQLTSLPQWEARLNNQRAYDFLTWGLLDHTSETLFAGIKQLRGGEYLLVDRKNLHADIQPKKWYELQPAPFTGGLKEASEKFYHLLEDAIRLRLRADVPIGSCLSGGLDSSTIVCLVRELLGEHHSQKTFSACSHHKRFDEREHIETIIQKTGVEAHFVYPEADVLLNDFMDVLWHQDEPFPTTSIYAQWLVFKQAKSQRMKVMLDGQGADEQLGGYQGFFGNYLYDLLCKGHCRQLLRQITSIKRQHPHLQPWMLLLNKLVPDVVRQPIRKVLGKSSTSPSWLDQRHLKAEDVHPFKKMKGHSFQSQSRQQLLHTSVPMLLHFEDRDSMAHSIESRTPFLDYRLVEMTLGLPGGFKVSDGWTKRVMREGVSHQLPPSICWRVDKMGFLTSEEEWVCREHPQTFTRLLEESVDLSKGILKVGAVETAKKMIQGQLSYDSVVWRQIIFGQWMKRFHI